MSRPWAEGRYARVRIVTEVIIPESSPLYWRMRLSTLSNSTHCRTVMAKVLDPENAEYMIDSIKRTRVLENNLDSNGFTWDSPTATLARMAPEESDDTRSTSTIIPEDHDSSCTEDSDPSTPESDEEPSAASWDFVVA